MHRSTSRSALIVTAALLAASTSVRAAVTYIGDTIITGTGTDLSGLPSTLLEDGVSKQNGLNGFGSGLSYAGNGIYYALADRGPNKVAYAGGTAVDNTTSYDNRYQQFSISLTPVGPLVGGVYQSYTVNATNTATTLLKTPSGAQYVGISTSFSTGPGVENTRFDSEAIRVAPDGTTWISDEYGPYILHFDQPGHQIGSLTLPAGFQIASPNAIGANETSGNTTGRVNNKGMEGLAISPDGKTLVGMMQSPLIQDGGAAGINDRIIVYDISNPNSVPTPKQYVYRLDSTAKAISDLLAVNNHQFVVDERNSTAGVGGVKLLYSFDLNQAAAPTDLTTSAFSGTTAANGLPTTALPAGVTVLSKSQFADIAGLLNSASPNPFSAVNGTDGLPDKFEGYAWGPDLPDGRHLLLVTNDNDFSQPNNALVKGFPNYIFAFAVDPSDVPNFQAETFVPEPASASVLVLGLVGMIARRRRSQR